MPNINSNALEAYQQAVKKYTHEWQIMLDSKHAPDPESALALLQASTQIPTHLSLEGLSLTEEGLQAIRSLRWGNSFYSTPSQANAALLSARADHIPHDVNLTHSNRPKGPGQGPSR